jgi:thiamine kinase-like enzyme
MIAMNAMITPEEENEVRALLANIPVHAAYSGVIQRLGGLTNRVYQVGEYVLRIPGKGTEEYINRSHESVAAQVAARAGVSPEVLYADAETGVMVTQHIGNTVTMSRDGFLSRPGAVVRAGEVLRKLHVSGGVFPFRFELFAMIDDYLAILGGKDVDLPEGYHDVVREAATIRKVLSAHPAPLVPCHCDPLCENFLDTGTRMWIVDWEYSGMNDPMWDLGDLSVEGGYSDAQDEELLTAYFNGNVLPSNRGRMVIYKAMCDLLWTLWGLIQHANGNPADDFRAYAEGRFSRCKALMAQQEFARHLKAIPG